MRREAEEEMRWQLEEKERTVHEEMERYSSHYLHWRDCVG